ncbi:hypothetical protein HYFRA_00003554 [Hymenoscyphus fraxineus]|uniref:Uncharacterized protein n=1 Tax=Hymenoscyphus fraxineus TaxID=746836 RepID=A0A9N9KUX5_9HELO|nr:hypothetical protein HYFRA_00003554 [Hymenoscyphus fraxineus]
MLSKLTVAFAALLGVFAAVPPGGSTLPSTLVISVVDASGAVLGTLNGYGNFSSPGPSYPYRAYPTTDGYARIAAYNRCSASDVLACGGGTDGSFYQLGGNVVLDGTDGTWSVNARTDAAGGVDAFGRPYGIPVHVGSSAGAIPVTLRATAASG